MVQDFIPGQRWINDAQLELGLGTVLTTDFRTVTIIYLSTGETNVYAKQSAPLTRVSFAPGDTIISHDDKTIKVQSVEEEGGLFTYIGVLSGIEGTSQIVELSESLLNNFIQLNRPAERLFNGQIDKVKWFDLRCETLNHINQRSHSALRGLTGCRTSLIPHQLYIAHEVANRFAPRVLLADEVGLGKTIEAGLILHQQLLTEQAKRVLIVVPESLVHQWLVEMLRRFNLMFHIFDNDGFNAANAENQQQEQKPKEPLDAASVMNLLKDIANEEAPAESSSDSDTEQESETVTPPSHENPFHSEQLVLCSLEFLAKNPAASAQCLEGDWDLLVVDEAHHLAWSETAPSPEYQLIESLAERTKGVLLLTATPEQLGKSSHFARLRLLDPDRFSNYDDFLAEEESYEPIALAIEPLLDEEELDEVALSTLSNLLGDSSHTQHLETIQADDADEHEKEEAKHHLIEHLLDRHGTGRILFRNTRSAIKGFPERQAFPYPLPLPEAYQTCIERFEDVNEGDKLLLLSPERLYEQMATQDSEEWTSIDPRIDWLNRFLVTVGLNKILIIAADANTALDIATAVRIKTGIHTSVFHEGMSLVERDRSAAWFSDMEDGCQVLVCSEIGSEGRNFQFAHHLVLFDLPLNPDLLEQRIGRLDRIGQTDTIHLHVPYLEGSAQEALFNWYHEGLNAFEQTCPAGRNVYKQVAEELHAQMSEPERDSQNLLTTTQTLISEINEALHNGRDKLLEYNSCRPHIAQNLIEQAEEDDDNADLLLYMESIYDCFNINSEIHGDASDIIRPSQHTMVPIPGLAEEGMTVTFDRDTALSNEDMQFLTWDHPLVVNAMDIISTSEHGNTAFSAIKHPDFTAGTILIEAIYLLDTPNDISSHSSRYLPTTTLRVVADEHGRDHSEHLQDNIIKSCIHYVDRKTASKIVKLKESALRDTLQYSDKIVEKLTPSIVAESHAAAKSLLQHEVDRLHALQSVNPNIRQDEIDYFQKQHNQIDRILDEAKPRLDSLRVIVTM